MIEITEITDKKIWEDFVLSQRENSFFQSWSWGLVQEKKGQKIWRMGIYENHELIGIAQIVKVVARRGYFLHLRHGPILKEWKDEYFDVLLKELKNIGLKEEVWFIRISSLVSPEKKAFFKKFGFRDAPIHGQDAEIRWILNLDKKEEEILFGMRKTTRYLIKKAIGLGVKVKISNQEKDFAVFSKLYKQTAKRGKFIPHRELKEEWKILGREKMVRLYLSEFKNEVLAAALIVSYGDQAVYHHSGAILGEIPASYALLWQAILDAKKEGKKIFNFWGIAPLGKENHPWKGLSLFKTGFGGEKKEYLHAQDLPLLKRYWITFIVETVRRLKKGY